ncbi:uncharacterized protein LOC144714612 isoform X2 [Wolffia australiana]
MPKVVMNRRVLKSAHPNSPVSSVRRLLSTGLMEGLPIKCSFNKVETNGIIKGLGYLCGCSSCNYTNVLTASEFGKHSGVTSVNHNNYIFLSNGKSLFKVVKELSQYSLGSLESVIQKTIDCIPNWEYYQSWKESFGKGNDGSDSRNCALDKIMSHNSEDYKTIKSRAKECAVCGYKGKLVFCMRCPKAFHFVCLGLDSAKKVEWQCPYCKDEIISETPSKEGKPSVRVIRTPKTPSRVQCSLCRSRHFSCKDTFNDEIVLICDHCEKVFHVGCIRKSGLCDLKVIPAGDWFCSTSCSLINSALQKLSAGGTYCVPETVTRQLVNKLKETGSIMGTEFSAKWQLLCGKVRSSKNKIMLSKVFDIFHRNFDPIMESSGRDLIPAMIHGRNMGGYELEQMHCVMLSAESVVVSAAIIRVLGQEVAELPLAATKPEMQGKSTLLAMTHPLMMFEGTKHMEKLVSSPRTKRRRDTVRFKRLPTALKATAESQRLSFPL